MANDWGKQPKLFFPKNQKECLEVVEIIKTL